MNAPGSPLWLLQFEALLWWRNIRSHPAAAFLLCFFVALAAIFTFTAGVTLRSAIPLQGAGGTESVPWIWLAAIAFFILFFVTSLSATPIAIANLYERRDLDLLLASPLSPRTILTVRLASIAIRLSLNLALYIVPYSVLVVIFGRPHLLGIYPGAIGICLLCASLVTLGLLLLVRLFGLQRARTFAQVLTVGTSATVVALSQFARIRAASTPSTIAAEDLLSAADAVHPWLGSDSWLWFPARTFAGDLGAIVVWLGLCGGVAAVTVRAMERDFFQGGQQTAIASRAKAPTPTWRFSRNFAWTLLLKEWRLLWRNPTLISRLGTQLLILGSYTLVYLLDPNSGLNPGATLAIAQTICGSLMAGTLTKITLSGEEAPDLLQTAPRSPTLLSAIKLLSALIPSWLLLTPLVAIALWRGESWLASTLVGAIAASHAGFLALCETRSRSSRLLEGGLDSGPQKFDPIGTILGIISMSLWSTVALLATLGWWLLTPICLLPLAVITAFAYARNYLED